MATQLRLKGKPGSHQRQALVLAFRLMTTCEHLRSLVVATDQLNKTNPSHVAARFSLLFAVWAACGELCKVLRAATDANTVNEDMLVDAPDLKPLFRGILADDASTKISKRIRDKHFAHADDKVASEFFDRFLHANRDSSPISEHFSEHPLDMWHIWPLAMSCVDLAGEEGVDSDNIDIEEIGETVGARLTDLFDRASQIHRMVRFLTIRLLERQGLEIISVNKESPLAKVISTQR